MIKNILVYKWNTDSNPDLAKSLLSMGYAIVEFSEKFEDYHMDAAFVMKVMDCIQAENIQMVLSWNYLPLLASVCEMHKLPYVSWICSYPQRALFSKTLLYHCNHLFCFDRVHANRLAGLGCENVYHFPLAVDAAAFEEKRKEAEEHAEKYAADISIVGSLYSANEKWLETEGIPEYVRGYIKGIEAAQSKVYGYNFVKEMIKEEDARNILDKTGLSLGDMYFDNPVRLVADLVNEDIAEKERICVIEKLSQKHAIHLYTDEDYQGNETFVFRHSKINLHVTAKAIESGVPQRVLDILACGGFCIVNYQPEIAEFFEDGVELVMYTDMADLMQKADYYLQHEEEREAIAKAGREKIMAQFSLRDRLSDMLRIVEEGMG
ncbi:MAG: glycosyltransferase [Lachnospiraceae bacterium]|nr:glycosyltransferase [Lachnospiraceae bacterium]